MIIHSYENARLKRVAAHCLKGEVLDIGYAQLPNRYFRGVRRVGVDLQAPKGDCDYEEQLICSATQLEGCLGGRKFDYIVAGEFIEHLERPYDFLRYIRDYLKADGKLILTTPNPLGFPVCLVEAFNSSKFFYSKDHTFLFTPRWMRRMLEDSGFRLVSTRGIGVWLPFVTLPCPATLSYQVLYVAESR